MGPPSITHANDMIFILPQTEHGTVVCVCVRVCVAFEGGVVNDALEQRAAVFRTAAQFWEVGDHEWQVICLTSRASYEADWEDPQWKSSAWMARTQHGL